jgi:hypothetical protein
MLEVKNKLRELDAKIYSQDLVNVLFRRPIIFANHLVEYGVAGSLSTAHTYLKKLEAAGLLMRSPRKYARKTAYVNGRLLEALSDEIDLSH